MENLVPQVFNYKTADIRVVMDENNTPWWVAKDVCEVLVLSDPHKAVARLDEDERILIPVTDSTGRSQETWAVNEPGLYSLIMGSRKKEAKTFKRWVTHDVIPQIRQTGGYNLASLPRKQILQMALEAEERAEVLQIVADRQAKEIKLLAPKAETYDTFMASKTNVNVKVFAKTIGMGPNLLFEKLRKLDILYYHNKCNLPYQKYLDAGYFVVRQKTLKANHDPSIVPVSLITPKGQEWLYRRLKGEGLAS